jgi:hypothetical protein
VGTPPLVLSLGQSVRRQQALTKAAINSVLDKLQNSCILCWYTEEPQTHVGILRCPLMYETITIPFYQEFKRSLRFDNFSCCYKCLLPLKICRPESTKVGDCSGLFKDILLPLLLYLFKCPSQSDRLAKHIGPENMMDSDSLKRWAKPKMLWNGLECSNIWLLFVSLVEHRN